MVWKLERTVLKRKSRWENYCCAEEKIPVGTEHLEVNDRENVAYWKCLGSKVVVIRGKFVALSEFI